MSRQDKDDLSRFFRRATQKPAIKFNEDDWTKLEAMLDKASLKAAGSRSLRRKFIAASVILLMVLSTVTYFVATQQLYTVSGNERMTSSSLAKRENTGVTRTMDDNTTLRGTRSSSITTQKSSSHFESSTSSLDDDKMHRNSLQAYRHSQSGDIFNASMDHVDRAASERRSRHDTRALHLPVDSPAPVMTADYVETTPQSNDIHRYKTTLDENPADHQYTIETWKEASSSQQNDAVTRTALARNISTGIDTADGHVQDSARMTVTRIPKKDSTTTSADHAGVPPEQVQYARWSILLSLAPDFSSNDFQHLTSPGEAFGLTGYYRIKPRLNVFAGVIGSNKKYVSYGKEYKPTEDHYWSKHTNGVLPTEIDGSCFMLEIPVGIQYTAVSMKKNRVLVSGMLSNYTMFNESYDYVFQTDNPGAAQGWKSKKTTSYPFSVAGISASFEHDLSSRLAIGFSPYMKIPLRDMGTWTTMKLYTVGAALTLRYTFQKFQIPIVRSFERSD